MSIVVDFTEYIERNTIRLPWSGCAIWTGAVTGGGYARSIVAQRLYGTTIVHRAVFQHLHGPVRQGNYVCHQCDTPSCVNPDHLFHGTPSDNAQDRAIKGRSASKTNEANGRAKLTDIDVACIRSLLADGMRQSAIADLYGVTSGYVSKIARGENRRAS